MTQLPSFKQCKSHTGKNWKVIDGIEYKRCPLCERWLTVEHYGKAASVSQYQSLCKDCQKKYQEMRKEKAAEKYLANKSTIAKHCALCEINKSIDDFPLQKGSTCEHGKYHLCFSCCAITNRAAAYRG